MVDYLQYLRREMFPHILCRGCGHGITLKAILRAIEHVGLDRDRIAVISGIGCSGRLSGYMDFCTMHTTHGRPLAFATGLKLARPELSVIVITGDGDSLAIGGNHLIHAARRNIGITCLLLNNRIYGMTGGQVAPTTPEQQFATTMPYGNIDPTFDACRLVEAAGASYVARGTVYHAANLEKLIAGGLQNEGFSFIEVLTTCPEIYGRRNRLGTAAEMVLALREMTISQQRAKSMAPEDREGKIVTGVLHHAPRPEYTAVYETIIQKAQALQSEKVG